MLVKWFHCTVTDRAVFERGQRGWTALRTEPGLHTQRAGWHEDAVHILAHWADEASYTEFMAGAHDRVAKAQAGTYRDGVGRVFTARQQIGAIPESGVLRLAHCRVRPGRVDHFLDVQGSVWSPGMMDAPGFQALTFSQSGPTEFLVSSFWTSRTAHEHYQTRVFPALRDAATPSTDLAAITGHLVELVPDWSVTAQFTQSVDDSPL